MATLSLADGLKHALQLCRSGDSLACDAECDRLLARHPDSSEAWFLKAMNAANAGRQEDACRCLQKAAAIAPDKPAIHFALGQCLAVLKREPQAIEALERGLALAPGNAPALQLLAELESRAGEPHAAAVHLEEVLRLDPTNARAHYKLSTLKPASDDDPRIERLEGLLAQGGHDARDRSRLAFALGRLLDQQGNYQAAFAWITEANRLRHTDSTFDLRQEAAHVSRTKESFTPGLFGNEKKGGARSGLPVFIVGMPRSGSTLVEQILASHPQVAGAGETMLLPETVAQLPNWLPEGGAMPEAVAEVPAEAWTALGDAYLERLRLLGPGADIIVDKQLFNYTLVGPIHLMLPGAKIIHCSRHPMATCLSCYMTAFRNDRGFTWSLEDLGGNYRLYRDLMAHWQQVIPDAFLEVGYEALVADPEKEIRRMLDYLGLPWSPQCLEFFNTPRSVRTSSQAQVRRPVYQTSLEHWKNYAPMLGTLERALAGDGRRDQ